MRITALGLLGLFIPACGGLGTAELPSGTTHAAIVGGAPTTAYPATVALMASDRAFRGQLFCSGTLVARRAVLTAAHCMDAAFVMFGTDPEAPGARWVAVREMVRNPSYVEGTFTGVAHDVAIAILAADAPGDVPTIALASSVPAIGTPVRWVGFGHTSYGADDKGIKRLAERAVTAVNGTLVSTANASCRADSGGSVYVTENGEERLAGSDRGSASMCEGASTFLAAADHAAWIAETIEYHGGGGTEPGTDAGAGTDAGTTDDSGAGTTDDSGADTNVGGEGGSDAGTGAGRGGCQVGAMGSRTAMLPALALGLALIAARRRRRASDAR